MDSRPIVVGPPPSSPANDPAVTIPANPVVIQPVPDRISSNLPSVPGYDLLRRIGSGGMGVVYLAIQEATQRPVALKMMRSALAYDDDSRTRFAEEIKIVARLRHPNIVTVYEAGTVSDTPYVALEYVDGPNLSKFIGGLPQDPQRSAWIVEQITAAIQYAHEQGVIHRDLKPANILLAIRSNEAVTSSDSDPAPTMPMAPLRVKVTDFGLAKLVSGSPVHTQTGLAAGTPGYMSPEQVAGDRNHIGPWTDVYSLGVILYEMLTGRAPFHDLDPAAQMNATKHVDPRPIRASQPGISHDLETICLKCLGKRPEDRYLTAADLLSDLTRFRLGQSILAKRLTPAQRVWVFTRRNPTLVCLGASLVVSLIVGIISVTMLYFVAQHESKLAKDALQDTLKAQAEANQLRVRAEAAEKLARSEEAHARDEARRANDAKTEAVAKRTEALAVHKFLLYDLLGSATAVNGKHDVSFRDLILKSRDKVDLRLKDSPAVAAGVERTFALYFMAIQDWENAIHHARRSVKFRELAWGPTFGETLNDKRFLADMLIFSGNESEGFVLANELVRIHEDRNGLEHPDTVQVLAWLAQTYLQQAHYLEAELVLVRVVPVSRRILGEDDPLTLRVRKMLVLAKCRNGLTALAGGVVNPGPIIVGPVFIREPK